MLARRTVLRGLSLSVLAVGAVGVLDACSGDQDPGLQPGGSTDLTLVSSDIERAAPEPGATAGGATSMHRLGAGLWPQLPTEGNVAISPFSVAVALGMTLNGAKGTTLDEMLEVLGVGSAEEVNAGFNAVAQHVESLAGRVERPDIEDDDAEIVLDSANSLFGQTGVAWEKPFLDALAASYGAGVQQVDYVKATESARDLINAWTAEQTRDKITELIPEGALDELTRLVLVNALYFKAPWNVPFESSLTEDKDFRRADGSTVSVPMMRKPDAYGASGPGWQSARLAYAGDKLAMTVVLADDLDALVAGGTLADVIGAGTTGPVDLTMPRWTFRTQSPLRDALIELGMPTAFAPGGADFSAMTREEQLFVSAVLHEVFIAVDERGTEAAAATAVVMSVTSAGPTPGVLVLDRPFLFVIHDTEFGIPLFVGRVGDPS